MGKNFFLWVALKVGQTFLGPDSLALEVGSTMMHFEMMLGSESSH